MKLLKYLTKKKKRKSKYGVMKDKDYSYIYKLNMSNGDQYSFIGVDSCTSPGPRGPLNFFGNLKQVTI